MEIITIRKNPIIAVFTIQCFYLRVNESQGRTGPFPVLKVICSFLIAARLLSKPANLSAFISRVSSQIRTVV